MCLSRAGVSVSASVWIVVAAMTVQGIYHPLQRPLLRRYTGLEVATYTIVAGTLMTAPILPLGWNHLTGHPRPDGQPRSISDCCHPRWASSGGRTPSPDCPSPSPTSLLYLVPPVAVFISWAWLGEIPLPAELLGGLIVITGVIVIARGRQIARALHRPNHAHSPN